MNSINFKEDIRIDNWRFIGQGIGIHWEDFDEDISISALLE